MIILFVSLVGEPFKGLMEDIHIHIQTCAIGYTKENGWMGIIVKDLDCDAEASIQTIKNDMPIYSANGKIYIKSNIAEKIDINSITGLKYTFNVNVGLNEFILPKGIYIVVIESNSYKVSVN